MAALLKAVYTNDYLRHLAATIQRIHPRFDVSGFVHTVFDAAWPQRELKARMRHITHALQTTLNLAYDDALDVLALAAVDFSGFEAMFFPEFVSAYGLAHWDHSITALAHFTQYSSSEFAVRPFIVQNPEKMMAQMLVWAEHPNHHIRRLASEGCRPRLPWAMALSQFKQDPNLILPIIECLKQDEHLYVRRSVANNLNDIAKDHPEVVLSVATRWLGDNAHTDWIVKHGCRTLLKQGHQVALSLLGWESPEHVCIAPWTLAPEVAIGETLHIDFQLHANQALGHLRIEYAIDFVRSHGKSTRKVFKIAQGHYSACEKTLHKKHSLRVITTRKYYPGSHRLTLIVNGVTLDHKFFQLTSGSR